MTSTAQDAVSPETPTAPVASPARRADIQGLRAVAVLLVVAFHAGLPLSGGFTGVDVFFVISGFVITGMLMREHARSGGLRLGSFYARRFRRLTPALALVVLVTVVLSFVVLMPNGPQQAAGMTGIGAMLLVANAVIARTTGGYFDTPAAANPLLNTWSLSVEEQFYLAFPALLLLGWWLGRRTHRQQGSAFVLVAVVTASSLLAALVAGYLRARGVPTSMLGFYSPVSRVWEFGAGALLALGAARLPVLSRRAATLIGCLGLALIAVGALVLTESLTYPDVSALVPVAGTVLVLLAGTAPHGLAGRVLSWRPLVRVGDWSYSVYLWHWPVIVLASAALPGSATVVLVAAALSFLPAVAAYHLVEQPLRHARWAARRRDFVGQAAVVVLVPVLASTALWLSAGRSTATVTGLTNPDAIRAAGQAVTIGRKSGCLLINRAFEPSDVERCLFRGEGAPTGWVLLSGDSHTDALSDGVIDASRRVGLDVLSLSGAGCLFSRTSPPTQAVPNCDEMAAALLDRAAADPPAAAILTQRLGVAELEPTVQELRDLGVPIIYVRDNPSHGMAVDKPPLPEVCTYSLLGLDCTVTRAQAEEYSLGNRAAEDAFLARHPEIEVIDTWNLLCTADECTTLVDGKVVYLDYNHLNAVGSSLFTGHFHAALQKVMPPA